MQLLSASGKQKTRCHPAFPPERRPRKDRTLKFQWLQSNELSELHYASSIPKGFSSAFVRMGKGHHREKLNSLPNDPNGMSPIPIPQWDDTPLNDLRFCGSSETDTTFKNGRPMVGKLSGCVCLANINSNLSVQTLRNAFVYAFHHTVLVCPNSK